MIDDSAYIPPSKQTTGVVLPIESNSYGYFQKNFDFTKERSNRLEQCLTNIHIGGCQTDCKDCNMFI